MELIKKYKVYVLVGVLICAVMGIAVSLKINSNYIKKLEVNNHISNVLLDSLKIYKDKLGNVIAEKEAFSVKFSTLEKQYDRMDKNNKELIDKISSLEKKRKVIEATNVHQSVVIDSLINNKPIIDKIKGTLEFPFNTKSLKYNFLVNTKLETLTINKLEMPNELFITHSFEKDKILVRVQNSNEYFKVNDINSYIIPLDKQKSHFKTYLKVGGIGIGVGIIGTLYLLK